MGFWAAPFFIALAKQLPAVYHRTTVYEYTLLILRGNEYGLFGRVSHAMA